MTNETWPTKTLLFSFSRKYYFFGSLIRNRYISPHSFYYDRQYFGVLGDIGAVPGAPPGERAAPKQPELYLSSIEIKGCKLDLRNVRVVVYQGSNMAPKMLYDSGKGSGDASVFPCEGTTVQGNFKVHVEHKPSFLSSKLKLFELWHNTLFIDRNSLIVDFMSDQLDIKKKLKPRLGDKVCLRLHFTREKPAVGATTSGASYEMVSTKDDETDDKTANKDRL